MANNFWMSWSDGRMFPVRVERHAPRDYRATMVNPDRVPRGEDPIDSSLRLEREGETCAGRDSEDEAVALAVSQAMARTRGYPVSVARASVGPVRL